MRESREREALCVRGRRARPDAVVINNPSEFLIMDHTVLTNHSLPSPALVCRYRVQLAPNPPEASAASQRYSIAERSASRDISFDPQFCGPAVQCSGGRSACGYGCGMMSLLRAHVVTVAA